MDYWPPAVSSGQPPDQCWDQAWVGLGEGFSGFWSSGAAEEGASGGSSEVQEDSTLSTYDNLSSCLLRGPEAGGEDPDPGGLLGSGDRGGREKGSPSWSSCEILPLEDSDDAADVGDDPDDPGHREGDNEDEGEGEGEVHYPPSPASCSVPSDSPLSTGSSDVFLPSDHPEPEGPEDRSHPGDAQSLLSRLQQEMVHQRAEYQAKILR